MIDVDLTGRATMDGAAGEVGIGLIAPFDLKLDREYWSWVPYSVALYLTRTPHLGLPMNLEFASAVGDAEVVARATRDLVPADPEVIVYACTSGSFVGVLEGESDLRAAMMEAGARRAVTTSGALLSAMEVLGVKRLGVGTPYEGAVTARLSRFIEEAGYETVTNAYLGLTGGIFNVDGDSVRALARAADSPEADAVFLSCTNLRTFGLLGELERELGKPVLSANQVTMWAALRATGVAGFCDGMPDLPVRLRAVG